MSTEERADEAHDDRAGVRTWFVRATGISSLGNAMVHLVTTYVVYDLTSNVSVSALITVFAFVPSLLLGGVATRLVRSLGGAKLYVLGGIGLTVAGIVPLVASATGHLSAQALLGWQLLVGIVIGLISPSGALVTRMLAAPGGIPELNGRLSRVRSGAYLLGVVAGGALYVLVGATAVFAVNVVSYAAPVAVVATAMRQVPVPEAGGRLRDLLVLRRSAPGLRAVFQGAFVCAIAGCFTVGLPAMARSVGASAMILTVLKAVYPAGGLFVATAVRKLHGRVGWGTVQRTCLLTAAVVLALLALTTSGVGSAGITLLVMSLLVATIGCAVYLDNAVLASLVQIAAPAETRGAVLTGYHLMPMLAIPLGQQLFGLLADLASIEVALACFAGLVLLAVALGPLLGLRAAFDAIDTAPVTAPRTVDTEWRQAHGVPHE